MSLLTPKYFIMFIMFTLDLANFSTSWELQLHVDSSGAPVIQDWWKGLSYHGIFIKGTTDEHLSLFSAIRFLF